MAQRPALPLRLAGALALARSALLAGCPPPGPSLTVRVQSGLRAEAEIRRVEVSLFEGLVDCDGPSSRDLSRNLVASDQDQLVRGSLTIGTYEALEPGPYTVVVSALRPSGGALAQLVSRCVAVSLTSDRVLRVPLTSDCVGVTCPAPTGSAAFTECLNGRCVDPRCDPDDPATADFCCDRAALGDLCDTDPTVCRGSEQCEPGAACAGVRTCEGGVCVEPTDDRCDDLSYCDSASGRCEPLPESMVDAGVEDAGADDAALSDAGPLVDAGLRCRALRCGALRCGALRGRARRRRATAGRVRAPLRRGRDALVRDGRGRLRRGHRAVHGRRVGRVHGRDQPGRGDLRHARRGL